MKLSLVKNPREIFDTPRGIALALIAGGLVQEVKPPVVPVKPAVWNLVEAQKTGNLCISLKCPACHLTSWILGLVNGKLPAVSHCGKIEEVPPSIADSFMRWLASRQPKPKEPTAPANSH